MHSTHDLQIPSIQNVIRVNYSSLDLWVQENQVRIYFSLIFSIFHSSPSTFTTHSLHLFLHQFFFPSTFTTYSLHLSPFSNNSPQTLTFLNAYSFLLVACKVTTFFFRLLCSWCPLSLHHGMNFIVTAFQSQIYFKLEWVEIEFPWKCKAQKIEVTVETC